MTDPEIQPVASIPPLNKYFPQSGNGKNKEIDQVLVGGVLILYKTAK